MRELHHKNNIEYVIYNHKYYSWRNFSRTNHLQNRKPIWLFINDDKKYYDIDHNFFYIFLKFKKNLIYSKTKISTPPKINQDLKNWIESIIEYAINTVHKINTEETEKGHLKDLVFLAIQVSDRINSPLCTLNNIIQKIIKFIPEPSSKEKLYIENTNKSLEKLNESMQDIGKIRELITNQEATNILKSSRFDI